MSNLEDALGRRSRYLRLSITDRCNFHCIYCQGETHNAISHKDILRYEEFLHLAQLATTLGVEKIRVTGGEPFARLGCLSFLATLRKKLPDTRLCVTTNGSLLEPHIKELARLEIGSLNISLDTFDRQSFAQITGQDKLPTVLSNIDRLLCAGLRVKINAVAMKGVTDAQFDDFIHAARTMPLDLRFIEFMPMGKTTCWSLANFLPASALLQMARSRVRLFEQPAPPAANSGPARMFAIDGGKGRLGFISPVSQHFCNACNRLRITSEGNLRLCLFEDREYRLKPLLRNSKVSDSSLAKVLVRAIQRKPLGADLLRKKAGNAVTLAKMSGIGG